MNPPKIMTETERRKMAQLNPHIKASLYDIHVVLNYGPLGFVQAITEYISHNQMQVNTGTITLNHNAIVEIVMSIPGIKRSEHHRITAQVSHCDESGHSILSFNCCGERTKLALQPYLSLH